MILKSFMYVLSVGIGLLLCSCSISRNEEYENFLKDEREKIKNEQILLEKQRQVNQQEQLNLQKQRERLKKEKNLLLQEKDKITQQKQNEEKQIYNAKYPPKTYICGKDVVCSDVWNGTGCGSQDEDMEYKDMTQKPVTGYIKKYYDNSTLLRYEGETVKGKLNGEFKVFNRDGELDGIRNYKNGKCHGNFKLYYGKAGYYKARFDNGIKVEESEVIY